MCDLELDVWRERIVLWASSLAENTPVFLRAMETNLAARILRAAFSNSDREILVVIMDSKSQHSRPELGAS
jgi:hypothetical protein